MSTVELTQDSFESTIAGDGIVIVDWWASWCGPCMAFAPVYESVSSRHPDIVFAKVDTEAEMDLSAAAQIQSIPTLMIFRDGILVFRQSGALPEDALEDILGQARGLDMDQVRAAVAEAEAANA
ncbi:MAG: thioredoxin [Microthrixaceae bacterium]